VTDKLHKEIRDLRTSLRESEACLETIGWAIAQIIPNFRATGTPTPTEHAAQTGAELIVTVNKLRACVWHAVMRSRAARVHNMPDPSQGAQLDPASPLNDWASYYKDQILGLLHKFAHVPFNNGTLSFPFTSITRSMVIDAAQVQQILNTLVNEGLATEPVPHKFQITPHGMQVYESFDGWVPPRGWEP